MADYGWSHRRPIAPTRDNLLHSQVRLAEGAALSFDMLCIVANPHATSPIISASDTASPGENADGRKASRGPGRQSQQGRILAAIAACSGET